ncbi:MAG: helix-turn-helix domain-containing protein [Bacteroidales bacterium]|nr:helix-turn-helix domain-containing protein [Bacteroidales bacterium]
MHKNRRLTRLPDESLREGLVMATQDQIVSETLSEAGFTLDQVKNKTRANKIIMTRHIIHYLLSVNPDRSFESIRFLFMKDHATVVHSRNVIEDLIESNRELKLKVITISTKIRNQNKQS